jgi:hypothetical protein
MYYVCILYIHRYYMVIVFSKMFSILCIETKFKYTMTNFIYVIWCSILYYSVRTSLYVKLLTKRNKPSIIRYQKNMIVLIITTTINISTSRTPYYIIYNYGFMIFDFQKLSLTCFIRIKNNPNHHWFCCGASAQKNKKYRLAFFWSPPMCVQVRAIVVWWVSGSPHKSVWRINNGFFDQSIIFVNYYE